MEAWCRCSDVGRGTGYRLDRTTGYWVHSGCLKSSKLVYEGIQRGTVKPQCPNGILKSGKCSQKKRKR